MMKFSSKSTTAVETDSLLPTPQADNLLRHKNSNGQRISYGKVWMIALPMVIALAIVFWRISSSPSQSMAKAVSELQKLAPKLDGRIVFRDDADFGDASRVWREDVVANDPPLAVIEAFSEQDVQLAVPVLATLLQDYDLPFRIRSGGHSKAGFSSTGGIILSLKHMQNVGLVQNYEKDDFLDGFVSTPHPTTKVVVATVEPGATVMVVLDHLLQQDGAGGTVGICGNVAEGGFVLGGGIGFMSRSLGLGIDNVLSFRIVLYDGTVVTANAGHPELFFALRGAGSGNYGVVTEMEYKFLHPMPQEQQVRMINIPMDDYASFLYQLGKNPPSREFMTIFDVSPDSALAMMAWFSSDPKLITQSEDRFQKEIAPLLRPASNYEEVPYRFFDWTDGTHDMISTSAYSVHLYAEEVWQGFLMPENNTQAVWDNIVSSIQQIVQECPDVHPDIELWGGAISDTPHSETAFAYRDALFNVGVQLYVLDEADKEAFREQVTKVNQWWPSVAQYLDGAYVNYPMNSLGEDEYPRLYWGSHLERLVNVKRAYDPQNIFRYEQSMPLTVN